MKTVVIKPLGGIAGDMFAGACAALWPDLREACLSDVRAAGLPADVPVGFEDVSVNGFASVKFRVGRAPGPVPTGDYGAIVAGLKGSDLDPVVLSGALEILRILGEAEARVHGKPLDRVHFHELADWDSIADTVAAASFIVRSGVTDWTVGSLPMGGGTVQTQHGRITVPAPAVLEILRGYDFTDDGIEGERITPTGAAILCHLTEPGARLPGGRLTGAGFGAGDKRFPGLANVVQLLEMTGAAGAAEEPVTELAFDIDDMTGEEMAAALDRLRGIDGVLDVTQTAQIGKKGRAMTLVRVLARPERASEVTRACFAQTTTLGVRRADLRRQVLPRQMHTGAVGVKLAARPGGWSAKAEADDLAGAETLTGRRAAARRAEADALAETGDE